MTTNSTASGQAAVVLERRKLFYDHYVRLLIARITKDPTGFAYGVKHAPKVADNMVEALTRGTAVVSSSAKTAARYCGIDKPNQTTIRKYLTGK